MAEAVARERILDLVRVLAERYTPQRIVLFGSYANGDPDADSDIDLLLIKDTDERFLDRVTTVRRLAAGLHKGVPLDPLVLTSQELAARLRIKDQFLAEVLAKGQVLYAA